MFARFWFLILFFLTACSSPSPEHYRERGSALVRALVKELKKVNTREELMDHEARIRELFYEITSLTLEINTYLKAHSEMEIPLFTRQDQDLSDALQHELNRLLRKEGCQEFINQLMTQNLGK